jgi:hypothetical protein
VAGDADIFLPASRWILACLINYLALNMEAMPAETSVDFHLSIKRCIPEDEKNS